MSRFLPPAPSAGSGFYGIVVKDDLTTLITDSIEFAGADFDVSAFGDGALVELDASVGGGGGFYGIIVKDGATTVKTDSILFPSADFTVDAFEDGARVQLAAASGGGGGGFYGVIFKESEAGGSLFRDDTFVVNSDHFYLASAGDDEKPLLNLIHDIDEKSMSIRWPSRGTNFSWFVPSSEVTVKKIHANLLAKDSGFYPYVDWSVYYATLRTHDGGTELITGGTRTGFYPNTNAHVITSFDNSVIPKDNYVWVKTTDIGEGAGAEEELHLTLHFKRG